MKLINCWRFDAKREVCLSRGVFYVSPQNGALINAGVCVCVCVKCPHICGLSIRLLLLSYSIHFSEFVILNEKTDKTRK